MSLQQHKRPRGTTLQNLRRRILRNEPLCRMCLEKGLIVEAREVDHIIPLHKSGSNEVSNLQPLCKSCHETKTITERGDNLKVQIGLDGWPVEEPSGGVRRNSGAIARETEVDGDLHLPFFSRVNVNSTAKTLQGFGYKVELLKIDWSDEARVRKDPPEKAKKLVKK